MACKGQFPSMIRAFVCSIYLSPLPNDWGRAHELHSLWQPFWPVMSTVEDTLNLTRLQELIQPKFMFCGSANFKVKTLFFVPKYIHKYVLFYCMYNYFIYLSTGLFWSSCTGTKQHGHVQCVHSEFLQSVEDSRSQVGVLTWARSAFQKQPWPIGGRLAQHTPTYEI